MSYSYHIPFVIQELFLFFFHICCPNFCRRQQLASQPEAQFNITTELPTGVRAWEAAPVPRAQLARQHCFTYVSKTRTCVNGGVHPAVQELIAIRMRIAYPGRTNRGASSAGGSRKSVNHHIMNHSPPPLRAPLDGVQLLL